MDQERRIAERAAREAGAIIRSLFGTGDPLRYKDPDSPLTRADLEANGAIHAVIGGAFPEDGWLSEETADTSERLRRRRVWIVDPLDGTREFVEGVPELAVSIALVEDGRPVLGVVYNPIRDELYAAVRGAGATLDGTPVRVSDAGSLADARVLTSRLEAGRGEFDGLLTARQLVPTGSVAYRLALVAAGRGDVTFSVKPRHEWDVAAGVLLAQEAGGRVTDAAGDPFEFNRPQTAFRGIVVANQALHPQVLDAIARHAGRG